MQIVKWVTGVLLIVGSGMAKITGQKAMKDAGDHVGVAWERFRMLGFAEVAGAVGVLGGLIWADLKPFAIAAAVGLALIGFGGVAAHVHAGDKPKGFAPALVLGIVAVVFIISLAA